MFRRAPLVAFTIVTMVALGLGLVAMVFTFLNLALFRVDNDRSRGSRLRRTTSASLPGLPTEAASAASD
jgi:hypothetical protein